MQDLFDSKKWQKLVRQPDWYVEFAELVKTAEQRFGVDTPERQSFNKRLRQFFLEAFNDQRLALADSGPNWDGERQPVDTIVIHHTSSSPGYDLDYMNMTQLLNIYARHYAKGDRDIKKGSAIWSNHSRNGRPSFLAYHWLLRMDGQAERLLTDDKIGWQAGNWDINTRSIAICLDNDYEKQDPTAETLESLAKLIKANYPNYPTLKLIGHQEAREGTICPGANWLTGWKPKLLKLLE